MTQFNLEERILPDNYPLRFGYLYIVDNKVIRMIEDMTVFELKRRRNVIEVKNCDIAGRELWHLMI